MEFKDFRTNVRMDENNRRYLYISFNTEVNTDKVITYANRVTGKTAGNGGSNNSHVSDMGQGNRGSGQQPSGKAAGRAEADRRFGNQQKQQ